MSEIESYKKKEIKFLLKIVNSWMVKDIIRMRDLPVLPQSGGNCNFPIVLYIFSCMEFLGYLIMKRNTEDKTGFTKERIWSYMEFAFGYDIKYFKKYEPYFVDVFRHGLAHQYFAKGAGISRGKSDVLYFSETVGLVLDADRFADIFIKSTKKFRNLFFKKKYLIQYPGIIDRVYKRFTGLLQKNSIYAAKLDF